MQLNKSTNTFKRTEKNEERDRDVSNIYAEDIHVIIRSYISANWVLKVDQLAGVEYHKPDKTIHNFKILDEVEKSLIKIA